MLTIAGTQFSSRLFVGTGKFASSQEMKEAIEASNSQMVTVALRRVDLNNPHDDIMQALDREKIHFLPNTSGARNAEEAIRLAKLARAASGTNWLKLEVTPDPRTLLPDPVDTLKATEQLVKDGFKEQESLPELPPPAKKPEPKARAGRRGRAGRRRA